MGDGKLEHIGLLLFHNHHAEHKWVQKRGEDLARPRARIIVVIITISLTFLVTLIAVPFCCLQLLRLYFRFLCPLCVMFSLERMRIDNRYDSSDCVKSITVLFKYLADMTDKVCIHVLCALCTQ